MNRTLLLVLATSSVWSASLGADEPALDLEKLKQKPITSDTGKVGIVLKQWWQDGTASGNAGDHYDNRDGDHSPLDLKRYPQLSLFKYSPEDIQLKKHWAAARVIRPHVTFGNSSTSAPAQLGGSNPRSYYVSQFGLSFLYDQYTKNNLYIYPEHRDHDPGHNGVHFLPNGTRDEGYGDMYPTNTPYLIISQGSSGSDQPFMRMMPHVLAAFRPEVKKKLIETGLLMPTIQMLLRSTNKHLKDSAEYLTGKAHPTVFEGSWVDELAMVQKAHAMGLKALPPMVQMRVLEEDKAENGIDFIDRNPSEVIANTPACIARVHRSKAQTRRLVVDAGASYDVNKSKLTYTWVVLRGDADKIKIVPKKDDQSVVEITIAWHERRPVSPGAPLESNRVDIGLFVHNGTYYSAPGFVTMCTLDAESRRYNERGVLLEIGHGVGTTEMRVKDWDKLLAHAGNDRFEEKDNLLRISRKEGGALNLVWADYHRKDLVLKVATGSVKEADAELAAAKDPETKAVAKKKADDARAKVIAALKDRDATLVAPNKTLMQTPQDFILSRLHKLAVDPHFTETHRIWLHQHRAGKVQPRITSAFKKLERLGIVNSKEVLLPLLPANKSENARWTAFEKAHLEWLHATLLAELAFPGMIEVIWRPNYVDHRLSAPRELRDVSRFGPTGEPIGWRRYGPDGDQWFNHEGLFAVERDVQGRVLKGRTVRYVQDPPKAKSINTNPLRMVLGDTIVRYEFDGKDDWRGRRVGIETVKDKK